MIVTSIKLSPSWRRSLPLLFTLVCWILYWYWNTANAMVGIWMRSETYAHAFIVPPITLWLIWRQRARLLAEEPRASLLLAIPVVLTTFIWLLGELTAVNALTQFSLIATLVLAIMALLGIEISKRIAFPLAFLFFAVPIGEFMLPKLMDWTAAFTVMALRASGIPVYQEGLQFVIPSGNWSVIEACSGIRYIIASITIGTLFAYLNYVSLHRRVIFIVVSIITPVIANWLRAYLIVMLGHYSGNTLAVGVDHLIYGWLFFGFVIMLMFMIGARWSEEPYAESNTRPPPSLQSRSEKYKVWLPALGIALLVAAGPLGFIIIDKADQAADPILGNLAPPEGWQEAARYTSWKPAYPNPSVEIQKSYIHKERMVGLYIGYYRNQDFRQKLVTSSNTLASSVDHVWSVVANGRILSNIEGIPSSLRSAELLGKDTNPETRLVVWQWYWINGKLTASDFEAKLLTALSRLRGNGDDSAVIMLYAPKESAADTLPDFAKPVAAPINNLLADTRNAR